MYFFPSNLKYFLRKKLFLAMAGFARPGKLGKRVNGDTARLAAGLERYAKVISILSTERWKKTINFTSNSQPFEQRGSPFVTNLLSSSNRTTYFMSYRSRLRDGSMQLSSLFTFSLAKLAEASLNSSIM